MPTPIALKINIYILESRRLNPYNSSIGSNGAVDATWWRDQG